MNQHTPTVPVTAATLEVPDGKLYYEVRGQGPLVVLVGAPMDANPFAPLADLLASDHTVLTTDPRGINRSVLDDPDTDSTIELRADDLARLIRHVRAQVGAGPAAVLGSSGGAVSVLGLAQYHPEQVHTVIAHEPPMLGLLDDPEHQYAQTEDMIATYVDGDRVGAMRKFLANASIEMPEEVFLAVFGAEPSPQEAADERFQYLHMIRPSTRWLPEVSTLRNGTLRDGTPRIVVGIGEESTGQICDRTSTALAAALGIKPTMFPGDHIGFAETPDTFAPRLRAVLKES